MNVDGAQCKQTYFSIGSPIRRCSVCREHELDRQFEQRPESVDDLLAGDAPRSHSFRARPVPQCGCGACQCQSPASSSCTAPC
jgi:hypothetical protein